MRIYRPADVLAMADQVRGGLAEGADQVKELLDLVPRLITMVQRAEFLIDAAERTLARADDLLEAADNTRARVDDVAARASTLLEGAEGLTGRGETLLAGAEKVAPTALPVLGQIVEAIDPAEVRAFNALIDRLPAAIAQVDQIGPDVHRILEAVTDLSQGIKGMPLMDTLIRRGERKEEEEAAEQVAADVSTPPRP